MEGKETELDKTIIESIKDPLTHLVRNAVDHGMEMPEKRMACGKSPEGRLFLRAFHEGGQVNIEISDDGAGIDLERVKQKALEKGLITPDQAARLSDRELLNLLFLPGFSTAEKVTNVSGRGVGMDVVKTNIEKIGGTVDIQNRVGHGATLKIKIPLTLPLPDPPAQRGLWGVALDAYCRSKKIMPVSPNTLYAHLSVIAMGLRGMQIEENAKRLGANLAGMRKQLDTFGEHFDKLGTHLKNAQQSYNEAENSGSIKVPVRSITC